MLRFGTFVFDPATGELRRTGADGRTTTVRLEPQPARALALLAGKPGDIVSREELKTALWGDDTHVDFDRGIAYAINQVRTALGDSADNPRFIETLPRRGFRFIAAARSAEVPESRSAEVPESRSAEVPESRSAEVPESRSAEVPKFRSAEVPEFRSAEVPKSRSAGVPKSRSAGVPEGRRWFFPMVAVFLLLSAAAWWWFAQDQPVVAVAIFDNETGRAELDQYASTLSDALVAELSTLDTTRIGIVGNARALRMPRSYRDLNEIRTDTGATFIVLAQLQTTDTGLRLLVHLIRLSDGRHVWVQRINRPATAEGLAEIEQQLLRDAIRGVRTHVIGEPDTP